MIKEAVRDKAPARSHSRDTDSLRFGVVAVGFIQRPVDCNRDLHWTEVL